MNINYYQQQRELLASEAMRSSGFTVDTTHYKHITKGYAVSTGLELYVDIREGRCYHKILEAINNVVDSLTDLDSLGYWLDNKNSRMEFNATRVFADLTEALVFAKLTNQKYIFDLEYNKEIKVV